MIHFCGSWELGLKLSVVAFSLVLAHVLRVRRLADSVVRYRPDGLSHRVLSVISSGSRPVGSADYFFSFLLISFSASSADLLLHLVFYLASSLSSTPDIEQRICIPRTRI